jgi:hypothetical protein
MESLEEGISPPCAIVGRRPREPRCAASERGRRSPADSPSSGHRHRQPGDDLERPSIRSDRARCQVLGRRRQHRHVWPDIGPPQRSIDHGVRKMRSPGSAEFILDRSAPRDETTKTRSACAVAGKAVRIPAVPAATRAQSRSPFRESKSRDRRLLAMGSPSRARARFQDPHHTRPVRLAHMDEGAVPLFGGRGRPRENLEAGFPALRDNRAEPAR